MKRPDVSAIAFPALLSAVLFCGDLERIRAAEPSAGGNAWTKSLADRSKRGTLHDAALLVRGDTGRWNDAEQWIHAPSPAQSSARLALDDWFEQWSVKKFESTAADDHWLLLRTQQLNDNDRIWVDRVERNGNRITVHVIQAAWRGKYFKNFTCYHVFGINLGKLPASDYEAECILHPLTFTVFDGTGKPQDYGPGKPKENWPKDETPTDKKPLKLSTKFTVAQSTK